MILENQKNGLQCRMQFNGTKCKAPNAGWTDEVPKSMMGSKLERQKKGPRHYNFSLANL